MSYATARQRGANREINKLYIEDRPVHEWYRFVLSFPPHLVREYLERFGMKSNQRVLGPFCGSLRRVGGSLKCGESHRN